MVKLIAGTNDLATINPGLAVQWSSRNSIKPTEVTKGSTKKVWWECELEHEWEATIYSRSSGNGCPICCGQRALKFFNDLATVKPELAKQWSSKNSLKPTEVTKSSGKNVWWKCELGHEWEAVIYSRSNGIGCRRCSAASASKVESEIADFIESELGVSIIRNTKQVIKPLELDIFIPSHNVAVEFNGVYWHSDDKKDVGYHFKKMVMCEEKNVDLIQIWEDDWLYKKDAVLGLLKDRLVGGSTPTTVSIVDGNILADFEDEFRLSVCGCNFDSNVMFKRVGAYSNGMLVASARLYQTGDGVTRVCGFSSRYGSFGFGDIVSFAKNMGGGEMTVTVCCVNDYYGLLPGKYGFELVGEYDPVVYGVKLGRRLIEAPVDDGLTCSDSGSRLWRVV